MSSIRVCVFPSPGAAPELRDEDEPNLEPGAALLAVESSEVCGTDVHLSHGKLAGVPYPLVPGHVSVGRLDKIRGELRDVNGNVLEEGQRVTFLDVHRTCNACWHCLVAKATTRCPERKVYGITYGYEDTLAGGWGDKVLLKPGTQVIPLDAEPEAFLAGGCGLPTALHGVERAEIALGDTVLVLGSGPVGLSAIALAKSAGASRVLAIGGPQLRLETARAVGAAETLDIAAAAPEERIEWVRARTNGRGADVVIEAAGDPRAVVEAMRMARDAGRVVVVGQYTDGGEVPFNPHLDLNQKHLELRGSWGSDFSHFYRAAQLACDPETARPWSHFPIERFGLADAGAALEAVAAGRVVKALIDPRVG